MVTISSKDEQVENLTSSVGLRECFTRGRKRGRGLGTIVGGRVS